MNEFMEREFSFWVKLKAGVSGGIWTLFALAVVLSFKNRSGHTPPDVTTWVFIGFVQCFFLVIFTVAFFKVRAYEKTLKEKSEKE